MLRPKPHEFTRRRLIQKIPQAETRVGDEYHGDLHCPLCPQVFQWEVQPSKSWIAALRAKGDTGERFIAAERLAFRIGLVQAIEQHFQEKHS